MQGLAWMNAGCLAPLRPHQLDVMLTWPEPQTLIASKHSHADSGGKPSSVASAQACIRVQCS